MHQTFRSGIRSLGIIMAAALVVTSLVSNTYAQFGTGFGSAVGGVRVDASGVLGMPLEQLDSAVQQRLAAAVGANNGLFTDHDGLRKLSLRQLNEVVAQAARDKATVPAEARFLGGLVRIEYVYVDQDHNDLILAGPADNLVVDAQGNVVGQNTGLPALHLEDLMTALQTVDQATTGTGISVSIEPTDESRVAFNQLTAAAERNRQVNSNLVGQLEEAMGPQNVILTGVPTDSRFANVLALADYRMKRISMGLDQSPLKQLPSFVSMLSRSTSLKSHTPRFWMEMNYNPVRRSEDGKVWQLSGTGVKTLTENDFIDKQGKSTASGKRDPIAAKWAANMTEHYSDLVNKDQIFGELRNMFDFSVVAALIEKEGLVAASGVQISTLAGSGEPVEMPKWNAPTKVPTSASLINHSKGAIVTASGGVQLDPWSVVSQVEVSAELSKVSSEFAANEGSKLVWN
ncbi:MAG: DUF1598 domain-containing protein [Planctomycetaceae bacterium]|nr:DUF1598 domain-containing protein [Planctomycetaceae bacterium]